MIFIQEIAGGKIAMNEFSWNSGAYKSKEISIDLSRINSLIGFEIPKKSHLEILKDLEVTASLGEAKRLIEGKAIKVNGDVVLDPNFQFNQAGKFDLSIGKKKFFKILIK